MRNKILSGSKNALEETLDILGNESPMKKIRRSLNQAKKGSVWKKEPKGKWTKKK